jgi:hypothetical protein
MGPGGVRKPNTCRSSKVSTESLRAIVSEMRARTHTGPAPQNPDVAGAGNGGEEDPVTQVHARIYLHIFLYTIFRSKFQNYSARL